MDWITRMNLALDYIEAHLTDELKLAEIVKVAYSSSFHFQRMFAALAGVTPAEYIRRRKLTMAASDLLAGKVKVIEVAAKYGYDSPNAFTRAFKKMHGMNPSAIHSSGIKLTSYNRISFHADITGGETMKYKIIEKPAFDIIGKSKTFEYDKFFKEGAKFWKEYVGKKEYTALTELTLGKIGKVSEAPLMSVYIPLEDGSRDKFTDVLAVEKNQEIESAIFEVFHIPVATYAEFQCTYATSKKMNKYIYGEWFAATGYERDEGKPDIAAYFPIPFKPMRDMLVRWWIPIKKQ